jgi:hypothetical protein
MRGRDIASAAIGCAALVVAVFAMGGAQRWAQAVVAALAALALIPLLTSRRDFSRVSPLLAVLGAGAVLCVVQLIPLPGALLDLLQPVGHALRRDGAELVGTDPWSSLSLDPAGTLRAFTHFVILLGIAVVALRLSISERGRYYCVAAVAACAGVSAVVVGIHKLFDLRELYGLYALEEVNPHLIGPLLNLNHLGGWMAVGTVLSLALVAYRRQPTLLRPLWLANAAGCASVAVATVSRGATLALLAGAVVCGATLIGQRLVGSEAPRRKRASFLTSSLPIGIVGVCAVVIVVLSNAGSVMSQLSNTSLDELGDSRTKFAAWRSSMDLVDEAPVFGLGRGAFETSFARVHPGSSQATFSHVENEYLQVVIDWGLVGGALLLLTATWLAVRAIRRWRDDVLVAGVLGAACAIAIQSTVDFGIELLGLAVPTTVLLATVSQAPLREIATSRGLTMSRAVRVLHIVALFGCVGLLISNATTDLAEDQGRIRRATTSAPIDAALERHPLDYYAFAVAAERLERAKDPRAIRLLNHALTLHPTHPGLHHTAARMLVRAGYPAQAAVEYAAALRGRMQVATVREIASTLPAEHVVHAIPLEPRHLPAIVRAFDEIKRPDLTIGLMRRIVRLPDLRNEACELLFPLALAGSAEAMQLTLAHCMSPLPDYALRLELARSLERTKSHDRAVTLLEDVELWQSTAADKRAAWLLLCDSYGALQRWEDAKRCLRRLETTGTSDEHQLEVQKRMLDLDQARRASEAPESSSVGGPSR